MKARFDTVSLLWLSLVLSFVLAFAFLQQILPNDYWWYMRIGRDTLAAGAVPRVDMLSYSRMGNPVVNFCWGAGVLFFLLHKLGGLTLTVLVRGLILASSFFLLWLTARRLGAGRIGIALALLLSVLVSSDNWNVRPQLFTYPLFALALFLLYCWHQGERKAAWWLPLISLAWVNLHGSFILLVLLCGSALLLGRGDKRQLGMAFAGVLLATLVNPVGFGSWAFVRTSMTSASIQKFAAEWQPPVNNTWAMNIFFLWFLAFPLLAAFSPRKLNRLEWTWFLGFGFLALWGGRHIVWFVFILAVLTSLMLAEWEKKYLGASRHGSPTVNLALSLVFLLLPFVLLPGVRDAWRSSSPAVIGKTPVAATEWLADHPDLPGPLWSEIGFSSYLEFALPERPVWIDTRFEVFPVEQWQTYIKIDTARYNYLSLLDETGANLLVVSVEEQPVLLQALTKQAPWCELYRDDIAVIFQRNPDPATGHCGGG